MHSVGSVPPRGHHGVPLLHSTVPLIPSDAPHCCACAHEHRGHSGEPPLDPAAVGLVHSGTSCFEGGYVLPGHQLDRSGRRTNQEAEKRVGHASERTVTGGEKEGGWTREPTPTESVAGGFCEGKTRSRVYTFSTTCGVQETLHER